MKVAGRITIFGEAFGGLLDRSTASVPTRQALLSASDAADWAGSTTYVATLDEVGPTLVRMGYISQARQDIRGDLPIEYGLASSSALALLHLGRREGSDVIEAIAHVDRRSNGFNPSGADSAAVRANEPGVFGRGEWCRLPITLPAGSHLLIPPTQRRVDKRAPTRAIRGARSVLEPLIRSMVTTLETAGDLDIEALMAYSRVLNELRLYSRAQTDVIGPLLARGVVAKGVGAMYDRAILVLADAAIWDSAPPMPVLHQ